MKDNSVLKNVWAYNGHYIFSPKYKDVYDQTTTLGYIDTPIYLGENGKLVCPPMPGNTRIYPLEEKIKEHNDLFVSTLTCGDVCTYRFGHMFIREVFVHIPHIIVQVSDESIQVVRYDSDDYANYPIYVEGANLEDASISGDFLNISSSAIGCRLSDSIKLMLKLPSIRFINFVRK